MPFGITAVQTNALESVAQPILVVWGSLRSIPVSQLEALAWYVPDWIDVVSVLAQASASESE